MQGDILLGFPIVRPPDDLPWPAGDGQAPLSTVEASDVVVMSQSCDLVDGQKADMRFVVLASIWEITEAAKDNPAWSAPGLLEDVRQGRRPAYHMLAARAETGGPARGISVVDFREVWSASISLTRRLAGEQGPRLRLESPYREHLSQAFARYFMRVGLPEDPPRFEVPDGEAKAKRALAALSTEVRARVIASAEQD